MANIQSPVSTVVLCIFTVFTMLNAKVDCDLQNQDGDDGNAVWDAASRAWRGVFFKRGQIVQKIGTEDHYVCLGLVGHLLVLLWKVTTLKMRGQSNKAFAVGTGDNINIHPTWASPIDLDDYDAVPTTIVFSTSSLLGEQEMQSSKVGGRISSDW